MSGLKFLLLVFNMFLCQLCKSQLLIKNINVLDVENKKVLKGYTVSCDSGRITAVEKSSPKTLPASVVVIDGTGKYLIPGLTDAHVHFFQSGGIYARPDAIDLRKYQPYPKEIKWVHDNMEDFLRRYTSAGITSVIDVGATYNFLSQRDSFTDKDFSPVIAMTGPLLTTFVPDPFKNLGADAPFIEMKTEEGARQSVREQINNKADFIKIWYIVLGKDKEASARKNLSLVKAAIDEAHKNKLRVAVHATERITAQLAVEAGADFLVHNVDDEILNPAFIDLLKIRNTVLCPTMIVAGDYYKVLGGMYKFSTGELELGNPFTVGSILDYPWPDTTLAKGYMMAMNGSLMKSKQSKDDSVSFINLKKLYSAGITIATGTDAGNIGTQHVSSYFIELKAMQDAGFKPWDLLVSSTINGAKAVGMEKEWGSISKGKIANMVLLNANPLDSLANWRKIDLVINKGIPIKPDSLIVNTPEMLVQQQMNAYNAHNMDAFLAPYSDGVEIYNLPNSLVFTGKEKMRMGYQFITHPDLHCKLKNRIVEGNRVIDQEEIYIAGKKNFSGLVIYVIENGKIAKVYLSK